MQIYVVKPGDTLYSIGRTLSLAPGFLARYNGLQEPYRLAVGQSLLVLYPEQTVTVQPGDTLTSIAASAGTDRQKERFPPPGIFLRHPLAQKRRPGNTGNAHVERRNKQNIDRDIRRGRAGKKDKRRFGVAQRGENAGRDVIQEHERQTVNINVEV